jgi:CHASE2 domain-containing sensor protein
MGTIARVGDQPIKPVPLLAAPDVSTLPSRFEHLPMRFPLPQLPGAEAWLGQVAPNKSFDRILLSKTARGESLSFADLANGDYVLRCGVSMRTGCRGRTPCTRSSFSRGRSRRASTVPATRRRYVPPVPTFAWTSVQGVARYRLQVAGEPDFARPLHDATTEQNTWPVAEDLPAGGLYWRAASLDAAGQQGPWSVAAGFTYQPGLGPVDLGRAALDFTSETIRLNLPKPPEGLVYEAILASAPGLEPVLAQAQASDGTLDLPRPDGGTYYLGVRLARSQRQHARSAGRAEDRRAVRPIVAALAVAGTARSLTRVDLPCRKALSPCLAGLPSGPSGAGFASEVVRVALLLLLIAVSISSSGLLTRVDHLVFDLGQRLNWRPVPADVLIVAIDEDSLDQIGRWPWSRDRHARLLRTLCASDPAVVAIDIAFSEKSDEPFADAALADAIAACGRVVLPLVIESTRVGGQLLETPPIQPLAAVAAGIGRIGVRLDEDGIARSVDLREGVGAAAWPLLAEEALRLAGQLPATSAGKAGSGAAGTAAASHLLVREEMRRFEFVGPPGSVPRVSYAQVLAGNMPPEMFAGKIVLVGATAVGLGDFLPTPVSALSQPMPGVEVQANVLLSMRDGRLITALPTGPTLLLAALLAVVPLLWLPRLMPLAGLTGEQLVGARRGHGLCAAARAAAALVPAGRCPGGRAFCLSAVELAAARGGSPPSRSGATAVAGELAATRGGGRFACRDTPARFRAADRLGAGGAADDAGAGSPA